MMLTTSQHETISQKADRLVGNYRVIVTGLAQAMVIGDHDTYQVDKFQGRWRCNCRWGRYQGHWKHCSHVVAAQRALKDPASQAPVAKLADLVMLAQARS